MNFSLLLANRGTLGKTGIFQKAKHQTRFQTVSKMFKLIIQYPLESIFGLSLPPSRKLDCNFHLPPKLVAIYVGLWPPPTPLHLSDQPHRAASAPAWEFGQLKCRVWKSLTFSPLAENQRLSGQTRYRDFSSVPSAFRSSDGQDWFTGLGL